MTCRGDVSGEFSGGFCDSYINDVNVEVNLPEWSGRIPRNEAIAELQKLIAFAQQTIEAIQSENVTPAQCQPESAPLPAAPEPAYPGQYTTWNMNKRARRVWHWNQHVLRQVEAIVDVAFKINEQRAGSWRERIVEQVINEEHQPAICPRCICSDTYWTGEFPHAHEYTCRSCYRKFQVGKDGAA